MKSRYYGSHRPSRNHGGKIMYQAIAVGGALILSVTQAFAQSAANDGSFTDKFASLDLAAWYVAEYDFGHPSFDTDWRKSMAEIKDGLNLSLTPKEGSDNNFDGASVRRHTPTHYGKYEAVFQAAKGAGLVTGFFVYTGPHYGTQHDEIDIEILGKRTDHLHVAWFVDGKIKEHDIPLGFDASLAPHRYSFTWSPEEIAWHVDGRELFTVRDKMENLPQSPALLFANIWAADPSIASWSGIAQPGTTALAKFHEITFEAAEQSAPEMAQK